MFERYTENARRAIFFSRDEATKLASLYIEPEHLLLGVLRACDPELNDALGLKAMESTLRDELARSARQNIHSTSVDVPLSNPSKRILAYAAEEADRLNSDGIGPGHLLLAILREESIASRWLQIYQIDIPKTREAVAALPRGSAPRSPSMISKRPRLQRAKSRFLVGAAIQLGVWILLGGLVAHSNVSGETLLLIGGVWLGAFFLWRFLQPSGLWGIKFRKSRLGIVLVHSLLWLYHYVLLGWVLLLAVGLYRVLLQK